MWCARPVIVMCISKTWWKDVANKIKKNKNQKNKSPTHIYLLKGEIYGVLLHGNYRKDSRKVT